jgi:two-component system OmpR family sensor kinase
MAARDHVMRNSRLMVSAATHVLFGEGGDPSAPDHAELRAALHAELGRLRGFLVPREADARGHVTVGPLLAQVAELRRAGGTCIDVDCPDRVAAELPPAELADAITNLLANCARHAPGSPVEIRARVEPGDDAHPDGVVRIEVRDHGPGIEDGTEEDVFRARHRSADSSGSGLGLDISRRKLAQYGGTLHLLPRGVTGGGCVAVLRVPARALPETTATGGRADRRRAAAPETTEVSTSP